MLSGDDLQRLLETGGDVTEEAPVVEAEKAPAEPAVAPLAGEASEETGTVLCDGAVRMRSLKRSPERGGRIGDGCSIGYRTQEGDPLEEEAVTAFNEAKKLSGRSCAGMQVGDVAEVVATGEHALADEETVADVEGLERRWRFEVATVAAGTCLDKFRLSVDERIAAADRLRERGNQMLKQGRLLRAGDYYERGSSFMDVIEAEDMGMPGGKKDAKAVANNRRIRECQKPILLNWALVLMRRKRWSEAERKCAEVILDIDSSCVKALFRRGQCQIQLGSLEDAKKDLQKARDLDASIADDVEKELVKLKRQQKALDQQDRGWAQKALKKGLADERSKPKQPTAQDEDDIDCKVKDSSKTRLMPETSAGTAGPVSHKEVLAAQEKAAAEAGVDDITYARQREAIYNQLLMGGRPE
ncbi:unnamed protein product [Durusdinium trenchii]|uniref:Peptidylprolyl isomerase n=1 Tax=Durusdinium trenchii TaxID=1381693 RepID=A0ABP0PJM7_9DINO